jgi:hypothetical protein
MSIMKLVHSLPTVCFNAWNVGNILFRAYNFLHHLPFTLLGRQGILRGILDTVGHLPVKFIRQMYRHATFYDFRTENGNRRGLNTPSAIRHLTQIEMRGDLEIVS